MDAYDALKQGVRWMWSLGDYARLAVLLESPSESLAAACDIDPGTEVLDVAAGNGNFALAAARRGAIVTASDLTPHMVDMGRVRSAAAGAAITWVEGDAEQLPFPDASFDLVGSVFGAMFAPRPARVAAELFRVVRPAGVVAMANYGFEGFLGRLAGVMSSFSRPAPVPMPSPFQWGDEDEVRRLFAGLASSTDFQTGTLRFEFDSYDDWLGFWEEVNGPHLALKALLPEDSYQKALREIAGIVGELNQSKDGRLVLDSSYLQVLARK